MPRKNSLTPTARKVLAQVADAGGMVEPPPGAFRIPAGRFGVAPSTVVRLERSGWLKRTVVGRNTLRVELTAKGRAALNGAEPEREEAPPRRRPWGSSPAARARRSLDAADRMARAYAALAGVSEEQARRAVEFFEVARGLIDAE